MNTSPALDSLSIEGIEAFAAEVMTAVGNFVTVLAIVSIFLSLVLAFFSYKILRLVLMLTGALEGFFLGSGIVAAFLENRFGWQNIDMVCGIVCAIVLALLALALYRFFIFLSSMAVGYTLTLPLSAMIADILGGIPLDPALLTSIISLVFGLIIALIVLLLFKPVYIIVTSITFSLLAPMIAIFVWLEPSMLYLIIGAVVGLIVGIFAAIGQFKMNEGVK